MTNDSQEQKPSDISARLKVSLEHHQSGRFKDAEGIYQSILKENPQYPDALHLMGVLSLQAGQAETAVNLFERAVKAKPDESEFLNICGEAYRILK